VGCAVRGPHLRAQAAAVRHRKSGGGRPGPHLCRGRLRCRERTRDRECRCPLVTMVVVEVMRDAAPRNRYVHSCASWRVSQNTIGTVGKRTCDSARPSATTDGRTRSSLNTDDQRSSTTTAAGHGRQVGQQVAQLARGQRGDQVGEALALDRGDHAAVDLDGVVAGGSERRAVVACCCVERQAYRSCESTRISSTRPGGPSGGQRDGGAGLLAGASGLPEDDLAPAGAGEHELGAVLARSVEDEVDRAAAPHARPHRHPLDDVEVVGPLVGAVAVDLARARPGVARLQGHPRRVRSAAATGTAATTPGRGCARSRTPPPSVFPIARVAGGLRSSGPDGSVTPSSRPLP
jgi:hypothetical protein